MAGTKTPWDYAKDGTTDVRVKDPSNFNILGYNSSNQVKVLDASVLAKADDIRLGVITNNSEYVYAIVDSNEKLLFGIKYDGFVEWGAGVPLILKNYFVRKEGGKALIDSEFAEASGHLDNEEYVSVVIDSVGKLLEAIGYDGTRIFKNDVRFDGSIKWNECNLNELETALKKNGFSSGQGDWSDKKFFSIPEPRIAIVNVSGINSMPSTKTTNSKAIVEIWDGNGNYFKKYAVLNAQGNSSLAFVKKNISLELYNDKACEDSFSLKIGDWVSQDSFHLKAYYTDFFRGIAACGYKIYKDILDSRGAWKNRTWKSAQVDKNKTSIGFGLGNSSADNSLRIDSGALCFPQGFPCAIYLNGFFYGLFSWQLKKHRDNYNMDKSNVNHIHLDGELHYNTLWCDVINWNAFEVRNPKSLYCMDGTKYDGDNPSELIDSSSSFYDESNKNHRNTAKVKESILNFSRCMKEIYAARLAYESNRTAENLSAARAAYEKWFDVENGIDYEIFSDAIRNEDGFQKNWQWTTWDGKKWFCNAYDLDMSFGASFLGNHIKSPSTSHISDGNYRPICGYIKLLYREEENARWKQLRDSGVISAEKFVGYVREWVNRIGTKFFELEFDSEHWKDTPCNNCIEFNTTNWILDEDFCTSEAKYQIYSDSSSYNEGEHCSICIDDNMGYYNFTCSSSCSGISPVIKWAFKDSIWRLEKWAEKQIDNMDIVYQYERR